MNTPRVPVDKNNWDSIEIFLFTNGQQYSPPRKYHLKSEELKLWDDTLSNLARSQFGSLHSSIDLYTLDGKKIDTPLELINDAAYVAVQPPDVFVQTGYEQYLIKAIRSREKRQERMNSTERAELANCEINKEPFQSNLSIPNDAAFNAEKIDDSLILKTEIEYLAAIIDNTSHHPQKDTKNITHTEISKNFTKFEKPVSLAKRKLSVGLNNAINKKPVKNKNDGQDLHKRRNTNFPKKIIKTCTNSKGLTISSNNTNLLKANFESKVEQQDKLQDNVLKTIENKLDMNEKNHSKSNPVIDNPLIGSSKKELTVLSDVDKNNESYIHSIFLDADRKTAVQNKEQRALSHDLHNAKVLGETPKNYLNTNKHKQSLDNLTEIQTLDDISNQPAIFHVYLRIDISGRTVFENKDCDAFKCNSYIVLLKSEKATQVNIDVAIGNEHLNFGNTLIPEESDKFCISHSGQENGIDNTRVILIHCKCNPIKSENSKVNSQKDNNLLPNTHLNDKFIHRSEQAKRQISDKETPDSLLHSCNPIPSASNSNIMLIKKPEPAARHKVSISQEAPSELNSHSIQEKTQEIQIKKTNDVISVYKIDNSTQTEWSNVLLQPKFHEYGGYTLHLPTLHLLKKYNLL